MLTVNEIIQNHLNNQNHPLNINKHNVNEQIVKNNLQKLKCHISNDMKTMEIIRSNKKLSFYSIFKTDVSKSEYLEQVKNLKHLNKLNNIYLFFCNEVNTRSTSHCIRYKTTNYKQCSTHTN